MPSLLLVLTGADHWTLDDGTRHPTGFWAEELITPMRVFRDAGVDVTIATPGGVRPTVDEASLSAEGAGGEERAGELRGELDALADQLASPLSAGGGVARRLRRRLRARRPRPDGRSGHASSSEVAHKTVEASMRAHWIHVVPYDGAWTFKHERGEPEGRFRTQKQAIEAAKEHARAQGDWELVIHGRSGRIRDAVVIP
jgi:putative intracellular protease/amidase